MDLQRLAAILGLMVAPALAVSCGSGSTPSHAGVDNPGDSNGGTSSGGMDTDRGVEGGAVSPPAPSSADGGTGGTGGDASSDAQSAPPQAGTILDGDAGVCPAPAGIDSNTAAALQLVNQTRAAMGSPCATMVPALNASASKHCAYYAANKSSATCIADPHVEVSGCTDYVAANFDQREKDAGYTGRPDSETMAFSDNGPSATQQWIDSVWHRTPVLSPWTRDLGYGAATGCDTMDFGLGAASPSNLVVTYPYDGQTGVPTSFNGKNEGPMPPPPPNGWPSGYPVHVYLRAAMLGATITTHEFSTDGGALIDHQWITPQSPNAVLEDAVVLYANTPLTGGTRYRVHVAGTGASGAAVDVNVAFTTK